MEGAGAILVEVVGVAAERSEERSVGDRRQEEEEEEVGTGKMQRRRRYIARRRKACRPGSVPGEERC